MVDRRSVLANTYPVTVSLPPNPAWLDNFFFSSDFSFTTEELIETFDRDLFDASSSAGRETARRMLQFSKHCIYISYPLGNFMGNVSALLVCRFKPPIVGN